MKVPDTTFHKIKEQLWTKADEIEWTSLADQRKSVLYEEWIRDQEVGGVLSRYMDTGSIRVYIKDTIMKPYGRERIRDFSRILKLLGLPENADVVEEYIKPHGRLLSDGKVICWGLARDWKALLFSVFERSYSARNGVPFAAVILFPTGKCQQPDYRHMISVASTRMGIQRLLWYDA